MPAEGVCVRVCARARACVVDAQMNEYRSPPLTPSSNIKGVPTGREPITVFIITMNVFLWSLCKCFYTNSS